MDPLLRQVGDLLLGAVPTVVIFLLLCAIYSSLVGNPLRRLLDERRQRTEGAVLKARADIAAAEAKTQDYEQRLREARLVIFKAQEVRRQTAQKARAAAVAEARERAQQQIREARGAMEQDMAAARQNLRGRIGVPGLRNHPYYSQADGRSFRSGRSGMKRAFLRRIWFFLLLAGLATTLISAQEHAQPTAPAQSEPAAQTPQQQPVNPDTAASQDLSKASEVAVHAEEGKGHEENGEFKYSSMVQKLGHMVGLDAHGMYWLSIAVNFVVLGVFFWMLLKVETSFDFPRAHQYHPESVKGSSRCQR